MREELTIEERLDMIEECNRKASEFIRYATDEDYKRMFSECMKVERIPTIE